MRKIVTAIIDNAARCPYFGYKASGLFEIILAVFKVPHKPKCYNPTVSKAGYLRHCNCRYDKESDKYLILEGCPLDTEIDEATKRAVLKQQGFKEAAEPEGDEAA